MFPFTPVQISKGAKAKHYGEGPWVDEPDYKELEINGYRCCIRRCGAQSDDYPFYGHLCGYVALPDSHPCARDKELVEGLDVHGGITYAEWGSGEFVVGFDAAHCGDLIPYSFTEFNLGHQLVYRDMDYMEFELRKLVKQLCAEDSGLVRRCFAQEVENSVP